MDIKLSVNLLFLILFSLTIVNLEAKALFSSGPSEDLGECSADYSPHCSCEDNPTKARTIYYLTCKVSRNQDFDVIREKLNAATLKNYDKVRFILTSTMEIPQDVLGGAETRWLDLSCSDRSTLLGSIHVDAFRSTTDYTKRLDIQNCGLTGTSFSFLSQFGVMQELFITSSSVKEMLDVPHLPQLESIEFSKTSNLESWYSPSQTPNLKKILMEHMPDLDDKKMESIMTSMTKNFTYQKLNRLEITHNSLTRIPPFVSIFPSLTALVLSDNPIRTLPKGSVQKGSTNLETLDLDNTQLTTIEPGAFVGDFSSTWIRLTNNEMTSFPSSVFKDLLKSMVNNSDAGVSIWRNYITLDCNLAWLVVENRDLLPYVQNGVITNGTPFEDLDPKKIMNC